MREMFWVMLSLSLSGAGLAAVVALLQRLLAHMNDVRDPLRGYCWERRPWNGQAAQATWDYTGCTRQRSEPDYEKPQLDYDTGLVPEGLVRMKKKAQIKPDG